MKVKFDFSEIVRSSLDEGLKSLKSFDEIKNAAEDFGRAVVSELSSRYSVPLEVKNEPMIATEGGQGAVVRWADTVGMADSWTLSAYQPDSNKTIRMINYHVDPTSCYPCVIQSGTQNILCSDIERFKEGLGRAFEDKALAISNEIRALSQEAESSAEYNVVSKEA